MFETFSDDCIVFNNLYYVYLSGEYKYTADLRIEKLVFCAFDLTASSIHVSWYYHAA